MPLEVAPLYRPEVVVPRVRAFTPSERALAARSRLAQWAELLSSPAGRELKESELLGDYFTDIFQEILGYRSAANPDQGRYTISRERLVEVDGKFADGALGAFGTGQSGKVAVAVEGKGPKDPLDRPYGGRRMSAVDQAYRYAINLPCDWLIATNLQEIRLYHKGSTQRTYEKFTLKQLAEDDQEFRRFLFILGAERVVPAKGRSHLYELLEASEKAGEALTQEFYRAYSQIRRELLDDLLKANPNTPPGEVLAAAQRLLDRALFIAFAEDRGLLPPEMLLAAYRHRDPYNPKPIWENFLGLFRAIDRGNEALKIPQYNGGLFAEHEVLDQQLVVPDDTCELLKKLGDYEYGVLLHEKENGEAQIVDVEILGHIFEQSIEDLEELRAELGGEGGARGETSKRRREGAFYTPRFVTRYIVDETLRPVLEARFENLRLAHAGSAKGTSLSVLRDPRAYDVEEVNNPQRDALIRFWEAWIEELKTVRALDPACGSGAFLVELFDHLHVEYQQAAERLAELRPGGFVGTIFDPDRTILENNLYGVDLNDEAIEIARLSIWIKTAKRGKILTDLDHNIRIGNSLIADPEVDPLAFDWWGAFPEVAAQGGFDVVVGNPPYVRSEMITHLKSYLKDHYRTYQGAADLYVYFYELAARLLRPGGRFSYIVTNKWLKAAYGAPLREFFAEETWVEEVLDLGHARQIFPDADVFPCIVRARKPTDTEAPEEASVCIIPRDELDVSDLPSQVRTRGFVLPRETLGSTAWTLDPPAVAGLMEKIRGAGTPLQDVVRTGPFRGIVTGLNAAFLIDQATRDKLVQRDPRSDEIVRPFLRGRDIARWQPEWKGEWMIFARRGIAIEEYPAVLAHLEDYRERLEPKPPDWKGKWPGRKAGSYEWYEIQDAIDYHAEFLKPKIVYQVIQYHPAYALDLDGHLLNDKGYLIPSDDLYLLGVLNSPLIWWYNWRTLTHLKDEALSPMGYMMDALPIATPTEAQRKLVEDNAEALVRITAEKNESTRNLLDWLRIEFGVTKPGRKLESLTRIDLDTFVAEVKKRREGGSRVSASELRRLRTEFEQVAGPLEQQRQTVRRLEVEISKAVGEAYGLTEEEFEIMWRTAPPRMPDAGPTDSGHTRAHQDSEAA